MTSASPQPRRGFEAFAYRDFTRYQLARVAAILGAEAQSVAVAWQVYSITHRAIDLGYTGLALFLPALLFLLPAGHVADRFDRRRVLLTCYSLQVFCTGALVVLAWKNVQNIMAIYAVLFCIGMGRAFSAPSSSSLIPLLVPEVHFVNAVTWGGAVFQFANITGPALGGLLFTFPLAHFVPGSRLEGAGIVYVFTLCTLVWFLSMVFSMEIRPGRAEHRATTLRVMLAGFDYVRKSELLLGSFSLDLFVVLLGGATALLPIFAHDILHQGPRGLGMLRAAPALGSVVMGLLMARFPMRRRAGKWLFICVSIFGVATIVFGMSRVLWLSLVSLFIAGAADTISVIVRSSLLQLGTPPEMRGRASAVNALFVGASNELGEFESGLTAQWWGAVRATVIGGIGSLAVAGLWASMFPKLRKADRLTSEALRVRDAEEQEALTGL
ncbi:MAG: MFS transporter [Terracidiphilus sp.]